LVSALTLALGLGVAYLVGNAVLLSGLLGACLLTLAWGWRSGVLQRAGLLLVYPVVAVNVLYVALEAMTYIAHTRYSVPYNVLPVLANSPQTPVLVYGMDSIVAWEIGLYRRSAPSVRIEAMDANAVKPKDYFLLVKTEALPTLRASLGPYQLVHQGDGVDHKTGLLPRQINLARGSAPLESFSVLRVGPAP
jgi:hypothetical protein